MRKPSDMKHSIRIPFSTQVIAERYLQDVLVDHFHLMRSDQKPGASLVIERKSETTTEGVLWGLMAAAIARRAKPSRSLEAARFDLEADGRVHRLTVRYECCKIIFDRYQEPRDRSGRASVLKRRNGK